MLLISALILNLMYEAPASEQNFSTLMYIILNCQVSENEIIENPLMMLFGELERRDPQHPADYDNVEIMFMRVADVYKRQLDRECTLQHRQPRA